MKKIIACIIIIYSIINMQTSYANGLESIYNKIDHIYTTEPSKLDTLNKKIYIFITKTKNNKNKIVLTNIYNYINFKFKNEKFYNLLISEDTKKIVTKINNESFTDQIKLSKLELMLKENQLSLIDKEYIKYWILDSEVSILLNHQDFKEAKKITIDYFKNNTKYDLYKFKFITKNIDYESFSLLTQLISWTNPEKKREIISYRTKFYPDEKNTAYNKVRSLWYKWQDCDLMLIKNKNIDLVDQKFCKLLNWDFENQDIKDLENLNNNIQNLSDRANYFWNVLRIKWYNTLLNEKKKQLWEEIIKYDKNFVNWYLILLGYYNSMDNCKSFDKYSNLLKDSYIWDEEQKNKIFNFKYSNCSI